MRNKKKLWAWLLTLVMVIGLMPVTAFAAQLTEQEQKKLLDEYGLVVSSGGLIQDYVGEGTEVTVPDGYDINAIGSRAFKDTQITSVELPESVTTINEQAFEDVETLEYITMPGVTQIGEKAFYNCTGLKTADISKVTDLGEDAFYNTGLNSVTLSSLTEVPQKAFASSDITEVKGTEHITKIGNGAFYATDVAAFDFSNVTEIGNEAFYATNLQDIALPKAASIGTFAFAGCQNLRHVDFSQNTVLTEISENSFQRTGLEEITLPESVTIIKDSAFRYAESLSKVIMPGVKEIEYQAFEHTALKDIDLSQVEIIGGRPFRAVPTLTEVDLSSVKEIGVLAFEGTSISELILPDCLEKMEDSALSYMNLEYLSISLETFLGGQIDEGAFGQSCLSKDAEVVLRTKDADVTLTENGVSVGSQEFTFTDGSFCVTSVEASSGTIRNETGKTILVNGEKVANNSEKIVGSMAEKDAYLASLELDVAELDPAFGNTITKYNAQVDYTVETASVTAVPSNKAASVLINDIPANESNEYTLSVPLQEGENEISIKVVAQDGQTEKEYTILLKKNAQPQNIIIQSASDLLAFAEAVNAGEYTGIADVTVELGDDIDMSGQDMPIIGNGSKYFSGTFDGKGHVIENLEINCTADDEYIGLFGATDATIQNLTVEGSLAEDAIVDSESSFGVIAGLLSGGNIINCTSVFTIGENINLNSMCVGGIVGQADASQIESCTSRMQMNGILSKEFVYAGGIAGAITGKTEIKNSVNEANWTTTGGYTMAGGIAGMIQNGSSISYSKNTGDLIITGKNSASSLGGVCGSVNSSGLISHCVNEGTLIFSGGTYHGGIVGKFIGNIDNCVNRGDMTADAANIGGIAAVVNESDSKIQNNLSIGEITAESGKKCHGIAAKAMDGVVVENNYYNDAITADGDITENIISGSTAMKKDAFDTSEFVEEINNKGGAYRLDESGQIEPIPELHQLTVEGSYAGENQGEPIVMEYAAGDQVEIDAGSRSGYHFDKWASSDGGSFADSSSTSTTFTMPASDTTITANWKKKSSGGSVFFWNLKFDTNGGSKIDTVTEWEFSTIDLDEYVPEKEGYKFVGWYADEDLTKKIDEVYLTEDTTVYAKWEKIEEVPEETEETEEVEETEAISFKDVNESDWFYEAISYAVENGLMSGVSEDVFAPNTLLTREMLAVVLYNVEGQPESTGVNTFTDVKADMWYTDAIIWANANGIVAGYDNGAYGVGDLITREQFAAILYRYAQFKGYDTTQGGMAVREFSDYESISDYARPAMAWTVNAGVMSGMDDGTLMPQGKATRAEAATMLMNFCENVVEK